MDLQQLFETEDFSTRSYNICDQNELLTLKDILNYYESNGTFVGLPNCGERSNRELIELCRKQGKPKKPVLISKAEDNAEILKKLSVRSYNVCRSNGLLTIEQLISHYEKYKTFKNSRNCGEKSNQEIINFCKENKDHLVLDTFEESSLAQICEGLSRIQKQVINDFINININNLSNRAKNSVTKILKHNLTIQSFCDTILNDGEFDLRKTRNIGANTELELANFIDSVEDFVNRVSQYHTEESLYTIRNKFLVKKCFNGVEVPDNVIETQSIFQILDYLIRNELLLKNNRNAIFTNTFSIFNDADNKSLEQISKQVGLTRERVRQLRKSILIELTDILSILGAIGDRLLVKNEIDITQDIILITDKIANNINELSKTSFSKQFITYVLANLLKDDYQIVGNLEDAIFAKSFNAKERHNWKNVYLLKTKLFRKVDITSLLNDISARMEARIDETYKFNFRSYTSKFMQSNEDPDFESITAHCETIVNEELDVYLDLEDNINFKRNTLKVLPEYVEEILEELGEPSSVEKIYSMLNERHPGLTKNVDALRGSCQRWDKLIYFGRSSTYGLLKWELEDSSIKGGTIKDMVHSLLESKDTPIHIYEIFEYVSKYRSTNIKSIFNNLVIDPNKSFKFYNQSFIGLHKKTNKYDENKYNSLPFQLGKKIIGLSTSKKVMLKSDLLKLLQKEYNLDPSESISILKKLQEKNTTLYLK